jgi:hypothetical protein
MSVDEKRADGTTLEVIHGVRVHIAERWRRQVVFQFALDPPPKAPLAKASQREGPTLTPNLVVTSLTGSTLTDVFAETRKGVLGSGNAICDGQPAKWEDAMVVGPNGHHAFQRRIAALAAPGLITLFVITTGERCLEQITRELFLDGWALA